MISSLFFVLSALLLASGTSAEAQAAQVPVVRPMRSALEVRPHFDFEKKKTRRSVSGIVCSPGSANLRCLVVFDEGAKAQFALLGARRLKPIGPLIELTGNDDELDAEGAALAEGFHYVTGSHSVKRLSCEANPASRTIVRFKASAPRRSPQRVEVSARGRTTRLWDLILEDPYLKLHADGCLGDGSGGSTVQMERRPGINIEGLAVTGGRLYAGFRAPSQDGLAPVFSVDAEALFAGGDAKPRLDRLRLGPRVGIRDMTAARDSILLLLGPDDHEAGPGAVWQVAEWKPGTSAKPRLLATLDARRSDIGDACFEVLKPEALAIVKESASRFRVVVLSDGICDGGPMLFKIPR